MKHLKTYLLLVLLIGITIFTYCAMPRKFEIEGGSCYQGISAMIIRFFLELSAALHLIALVLMLKSKVKAPKVLSILALVLWSLVSFANSDGSSDAFRIGMDYFTPFLVVSILIVMTAMKNKKNCPISGAATKQNKPI